MNWLQIAWVYILDKFNIHLSKVPYFFAAFYLYACTFTYVETVITVWTVNKDTR